MASYAPRLAGGWVAGVQPQLLRLHFSDRDVLVEFITSVDGLTTDEVHDRTNAALDVLRGR